MPTEDNDDNIIEIKESSSPQSVKCPGSPLSRRDKSVHTDGSSSIQIIGDMDSGQATVPAANKDEGLVGSPPNPKALKIKPSSATLVAQALIDTTNKLLGLLVRDKLVDTSDGNDD